MSDPRILIAGIGNIFLGDDAFGVEVAQKMALRALPQGVHVVDFGIRALDLTYALLDECDIAIIVDAVPRGEAPGTLFVIEPEPISEDQNAAADLAAGSLLIEGHSMDPVKVLRVVHALGGKVRRILVVGCEPSACDSPEEMQMEMTPPVKQAVDEAIKMIEMIVVRLRSQSYDEIEAINQGDTQNDHIHTSG